MKKLNIYYCISREGVRFPIMASSKRAIPADHSLLCEEIPLEELDITETVSTLKRLMVEAEEGGRPDEHNALLSALKVFTAFVNTVSYNENN